RREAGSSRSALAPPPGLRLRVFGTWSRAFPPREPEQPRGDVEGRPGAREPERIGAERRESRGVVEQAVDLVGEGRRVVAPDRRPLLEQVVAVPLLLPGDRVDDHEGEAPREGLRGGEAARLAEQEV